MGSTEISQGSGPGLSQDLNAAPASTRKSPPLGAGIYDNTPDRSLGRAIVKELQSISDNEAAVMHEENYDPVHFPRESEDESYYETF